MPKGLARWLLFVGTVGPHARHFGIRPGPTPLWSREEHVDLLQPRRVWLVSWLGSLAGPFSFGGIWTRLEAALWPLPTLRTLSCQSFFSPMTVAAASAAWKFRPGEVLFGPRSLHVNMYDDAVSGTKKSPNHSQFRERRQFQTRTRQH